MCDTSSVPDILTLDISGVTGEGADRYNGKFILKRWKDQWIEQHGKWKMICSNNQWIIIPYSQNEDIPKIVASCKTCSRKAERQKKFEGKK